MNFAAHRSWRERTKRIARRKQNKTQKQSNEKRNTITVTRLPGWNKTNMDILSFNIHSKTLFERKKKLPQIDRVESLLELSRWQKLTLCSCTRLN